MRLFEKAVADFMGRHLYRPLKEINIGQLLQHLLELSASHQLRVPPDIFLMLKTLTAVEGVALMLDPEFDIFQASAPFIAQVKLARYHPRRLATDFMRMSSDLMAFMQQYPNELLEITRQIRQRKFVMNVDMPNLHTMLETHDQISNRVSLAIIIAGLIIGSSIIVVSGIPPLFYGISIIGIIVFITGALMGLWLLVAIIKKGRF
jgi:ubiquinone biosynthesis protein